MTDPQHLTISLAFTLLGLLLAARSVTRPTLIYWAFLLFVLAVFTKQSLIAAPLTAFLIVLTVHPRHTTVAVCLAFVAGLTFLWYMTIATDGGFVQHIFIHNINRFEISRAAALVARSLRIHPLYLVITVSFLIMAFRRARSQRIFDGLAAIRTRLQTHRSFRVLLFSSLYLTVNTVTLIAVASPAPALTISSSP